MVPFDILDDFVGERGVVDVDVHVAVLSSEIMYSNYQLNKAMFFR